MEVFLMLIRNALLAVGGAGIVAGSFTEQEWATIVSALLIVASAVWKWIERKRHQAAGE